MQNDDEKEKMTDDIKWKKITPTSKKWIRGWVAVLCKDMSRKIVSHEIIDEDMLFYYPIPDIIPKEEFEKINLSKHEEVNCEDDCFLDIEPTEKMKWIDVQKELPKDAEQVLVLVEGNFICNDHNVFSEKKSFRIFQATFERSSGWIIPFYIDKKFPVKYWMNYPEFPDNSIVR